MKNAKPKTLVKTLRANNIMKKLGLLILLSLSINVAHCDDKQSDSVYSIKQNEANNSECIFTWRGKVGEDDVNFQLEVSAFNIKNHKVDSEKITVDGYPSPFLLGVPREGRNYIKSFKIEWAGQKLDIPQNVFNSLPYPYIHGEVLNCVPDGESLTTTAVIPSCGGDSILIVIPFEPSAAAGSFAFTITKDGKVYRSMLQLKL